MGCPEGALIPCSCRFSAHEDNQKEKFSQKGKEKKI
jgi:hypothetical protein